MYNLQAIAVAKLESISSSWNWKPPLASYYLNPKKKNAKKLQRPCTRSDNDLDLVHHE